MCRCSRHHSARHIKVHARCTSWFIIRVVLCDQGDLRTSGLVRRALPGTRSRTAGRTVPHGLKPIRCLRQSTASAVRLRHLGILVAWLYRIRQSRCRVSTERSHAISCHGAVWRVRRCPGDIAVHPPPGAITALHRSANFDSHRQRRDRRVCQRARFCERLENWTVEGWTFGR
jgi:hypothetical protein